MRKPLSIKSLVLRNLRESAEPLFYLAPDVVGSINNAHTAKGKKLVVIDFNTIDDHNMKLVVPHKCYSDYQTTNASQGNGVKNFLLKFLDGIRPYQEGDGILDEIVDEFGNIYDEKDDLPPGIRSNPGQGQTKSSDSGKRQYVAQYTRMISPLGYGGVVW